MIKFTKKITTGLIIGLLVIGFACIIGFNKDTFGALPVFSVPQGGTGASTFTSGYVLTGNGTGAITATNNLTLGNTTTTNATTTGSLYVGNDLTVAGDTTLVDVYLTNYEITGNSTTTGYQSVGTDDGSFNFTAGDLNASGELRVGEGATFAGNVGIGTTNPTAYLNISNSGWTAGSQDPVFLLEDSAGTDIFKITRYGQAFFRGKDANSSFAFQRSDGITYSNFNTLNDNGVFNLFDSGGNQDVRLDTNGNSYFNGGNVGIGTTTIGAKLDIQKPASGNIFAISNNLSGDLLTVDNLGNFGFATTTPLSKIAISGGLSVGENYNIGAPTNGAIFEGNVGIGTNREYLTNGSFEGTYTPTTNPAGYTINVAPGWSSFDSYLGGGESTEAHGGLKAQTEVNWVGGGGAIAGVEQNISVPSGAKMVLSIWLKSSSLPGGAYLQAYDLTNSVELSVSTPAVTSAYQKYTLNFDTGANTSSVRIKIGNNVGNYSKTIYMDDASVQQRIRLNVWGLAGNNDVFNVASSTGTSLLTVNSVGNTIISGNVGIGLTAPTALLHIQRASGGTDPLFQVGTSTSAGMLVVKSSGNVGIGTTTPSQKLDIVGNLEVNGNATTTGSMNIDGDLTVDGTINGADYGFANGWLLTENFKLGKDYKGLTILDENRNEVFEITKDGASVSEKPAKQNYWALLGLLGLLGLIPRKI